MVRHSLLPLLSLALLIFAIAHAISIQQPEPETPPPVTPSLTPFGQTVAGLGIVEPSTEASGTGNIAIGSNLAGTVVQVAVHIGQTVNAGDLLFELDQRQALAELKLREAARKADEEQLRKLELEPRPEEVAVSQAAVEIALAKLRDEQRRFDIAKKLVGTAAISQDDYLVREQAQFVAEAELKQAQAQLTLLQSGAWQPDKEIARARVSQAQALVDQANVTLSLLQIRAPVAGTIMQVNVRPGEFAPAQAGTPLILMGNLRPLHVRVNVDEEDLPRLKLHAPARAKLRGDRLQREVRLAFVRLEPHVVPKTALTGMNTERVDTRVVQVIYAVADDNAWLQDQPLLVGQVLDVFIDNPTEPTDSPSPTTAAHEVLKE